MTTSSKRMLNLNEGAPLKGWRPLVDYIYKDSPQAMAILVEHSQAVAEFAKKINAQRHLGLDDECIEEAAMLHDIGIVKTFAPGIGCKGNEPYIRHGVLGADLLRELGYPEYVARVAERHTGAGITTEDIRLQNLPLPEDRILYPETELEKLVCYADKFFSKRPGRLSERKDAKNVRAEMEKHGPETLQRFVELDKRFGL